MTEFNGYSMNLCHGMCSPTEMESPAMQPVRRAAFAPASRAPIYGCYDTYLGHGIVGGSMD